MSHKIALFIIETGKRLVDAEREVNERLAGKTIISVSISTESETSYPILAVVYEEKE
jgi:hypothetical protein